EQSEEILALKGLTPTGNMAVSSLPSVDKIKSMSIKKISFEEARSIDKMNERIPPFSSSHYTSIYNSSNTYSSSSYIHQYHSPTKLPSSMHISQQKTSKISQIADKQQLHRNDSITGRTSNGNKLSLSSNNNEANADPPSSGAGGAGSSSSDVRTSGGSSADAASDNYNQESDNHGVIVKRSHSFQEESKSISGFQSDHHISTANNNTINSGSGVSTKSIFRRSLRSAFESIRPSFDRQSSIEQQLTGDRAGVDDDISSTDNNQQQRHHHFMHRFPHGNRLIGNRKCKSSSNIFGAEAEPKSPPLNDRNS
ncbi:hypothetical protein GJ496_006680, partial [Pomphorhynchus laevis]